MGTSTYTFLTFSILSLCALISLTWIPNQYSALAKFFHKDYWEWEAYHHANIIYAGVGTCLHKMLRNSIKNLIT